MQNNGCGYTLRELSQEYRLFEATFSELDIAGVPIWEIARPLVFGDCMKAAGLFGAAHPPPRRTFSNVASVGINALRSLLTNLTGGRDTADILVVGHPRMVKNGEGQFEDPYSESYLRQARCKSLYLEKSFRGHHFTPRVEGRKLWYDHVCLQQRLRRFVLKGKDLADVSNLEEHFRELFGFSVDLRTRVEQLLTSREVFLPYFEKVVQHFRPKVAVVVVAYYYPFLLEVCKQRQIPTIEIQHGMISPYHFGYDFRDVEPSLYFPDELWLWGAYWKTAAKFPCATKLQEVGWPHFDECRCYRRKVRKPGCLFISQGAIGDRLAEIALDLRREHPEIDVYFRLHPSEHDKWHRDYGSLEAAKIKVLGPDSGSLYEWLGKMQHVVGGFSTALLEALGMGCQVGVLDVPGHEYLDELVECGAIHSVGGDWPAFWRTESSKFEPTDFFTPFCPSHVESLLRRTVSQSAG